MAEADDLDPVAMQLVLHWGEMGSRWGINRTVAQIQAVLYLSARPLSAEEIAGLLGVARSNVSTSLRELLAWGVIRVVPMLGQRTTCYESLTDVWEMFRLVVAERKRREIDPIVDVLRACAAAAEADGDADPALRRKLREMLQFFETTTACYEEIARLSPATLRRLVGVRGKVKKLLG